MAAARRILLLGAGGFVGGHLAGALEDRFGAGAAVTRTGLRGGAGLRPLDLRDAPALRDALRDLRPTHVVNLVGIAAPAEARRDPDAAWQAHAVAVERLGRLILQDLPDCWLVHVGSGLAYGRSALDGAPVAETAPLEPMDIYGVTKAAGDLALGALAGEGLRCLRLRPFNHTGPGQSEAFVIPAFAAQIARIEAGRQPPVIRVGNLDAVRDFLDVRDVVAAYADLVAAAGAMAPGRAVNIASGRGRRIGDLLDALCRMARVPVTVEPDPDRQRPSDLPALVGDAGVLAAATGWAPRHGLDETLRATLDDARARLA